MNEGSWLQLLGYFSCVRITYFDISYCKIGVSFFFSSNSNAAQVKNKKCLSRTSSFVCAGVHIKVPLVGCWPEPIIDSCRRIIG